MDSRRLVRESRLSGRFLAAMAGRVRLVSEQWRLSREGPTLDFTIRRLDASTRDAFAEFVETKNGSFSSCWCQFGVPDEVPRIKSRAAHERGPTTHPDSRIATSARETVVRVSPLPGYLDHAASVPAGFLENGARSTYEKLGVTPDRKIGKHRWVVTKLVLPAT